MRTPFNLFKPLILLFLFPLFSSAQFRVSLESGPAFSQYNNVRVPNAPQNPGSYFSLHEDFSPDQGKLFVRFEIRYLLKDRHSFELTAAPLTLNYLNAKINPIHFAGETFTGQDIDGVYKFNTYRASYRYRVLDKEKVSLDLGASVLLRDARIALDQNGKVAEDTDLGVVPLLSFELNYAPSEQIAFMLKGDALVGPQGRAEDIFAGALVPIFGERLRFKFGYRFIEGGADVDQVYNFAFIHFADVGLVLNIGK